jgi:hypothetical protein
MFGLNAPVYKIDPFGLAPGECYKTRNEAAKAALCEMYQLTKKTGWEWGGKLYQNPKDGCYSYTPLITSESSTMVETSKAVMPPNVKYRGSFHSHPYLPPPYLPEEFGGQDIFAAEATFHESSPDKRHPNYLVTPSGNMIRYDPNGRATGNKTL